jgi:hypothetical protein
MFPFVAELLFGEVQGLQPAGGAACFLGAVGLEQLDRSRVEQWFAGMGKPDRDPGGAKEVEGCFADPAGGVDPVLPLNPRHTRVDHVGAGTVAEPVAELRREALPGPTATTADGAFHRLYVETCRRGFLPSGRRVGRVQGAGHGWANHGPARIPLLPPGGHAFCASNTSLIVPAHIGQQYTFCSFVGSPYTSVLTNVQPARSVGSRSLPMQFGLSQLIDTTVSSFTVICVLRFCGCFDECQAGA